MVLEFKDINDWKPSYISIVDKPGHPLAVFEVYEDDTEFVRKFVDNDNGEIMTGENETNVDEGNVQMSEGLFERLFGGLVSKSVPVPPTNNEPPVKPPVKEGNEDDIKSILTKMNEKLDSMDARLSKLEGGKGEGEGGDPVPGAVKKNDAEGGENVTPTDGASETGETGESSVNPDGTINEDKVVSKSIDPDLVKKNDNVPDKSFMERIGRSSDGMRW